MVQQQQKYVIVQHSGFGYKADPAFERALETRRVNTVAEEKLVEMAGGVMIDGYVEAEDYCDNAMYEEGSVGIIPRVKGTFSAARVDGLAIYVPPKLTAPLQTAADVEELEEHLGEHINDNDDPAYNNGVRAGFAATAFKAFAIRVGGGEVVETTISDLLADLMHLCDSLDLSFEDAVVRAESHYLPESEGTF